MRGPGRRPTVGVVALETADRPHPSLVIADDDPVVCAMLSAQLERHFRVLGVAADAAGAIRLASAHRPDLALLDVEMPGGGPDATREIHAQSPDTAVVILSIDTSRASVLRFLDAGAAAYLRKGIPAERLVQRLVQATHVRRGGGRAAHDARAADERFRAAFDEAAIGMAIMPLEGERAGRLIAANAAYARILGREPHELIGANAETWTHAEHLPEGIEDPLAALATGERDRVEFETRFVHRRGHPVWASVTAASFHDEDGVLAAVVQVIDVSERKRLEAELVHLADHDALTGLFNRRRFDAELDREVGRTHRYGGRGSVLLLDLDGFKQVNDTLGHEAGDELIGRLGPALRLGLRDSDVAARIGGDEFALLLPETEAGGAMVVAQRLLDAVRREGVVQRGGAVTRVTASIGITMFAAGDGLGRDDLLRAADVAMYAAKAAGKDSVSVHPGAGGDGDDVR